MKTYTITVSGRTMPDIEAAIRMVGTAITFDEQQQGMDSNESLSYAFKSSGEFNTQEIIAVERKLRTNTNQKIRAAIAKNIPAPKEHKMPGYLLYAETLDHAVAQRMCDNLWRRGYHNYMKKDLGSYPGDGIVQELFTVFFTPDGRPRPQDA